MENDGYVEIPQKKLLFTTAHKLNLSHGVVAKQRMVYVS